MQETEFSQLADQVLQRIELAIDQQAEDADWCRSGNVLEVEFDDGQKIVINRHDANQEIWVAAKSGGFHYAWQQQAWHSKRDGSELFERLQALFAEQGETIHF